MPADARRLAEIFRASIEALAAEDYDDDQREAWAATADDEDAFGERLAGALTLIAVIDGATAGFASLKGADAIDMLYVDPQYAGQGAGRALIEALTRLAGARGAKRLTVEASEVARPLVRAAGLRRPEAQSGARRRPVARQHHVDENARRSAAGAAPTLTSPAMSPRERLYLFDTSLRDGALTTGVDFSLDDKRRIAAMLERLGIDYIEGGYPGANPLDTEFFKKKPTKTARFCAFGMTKRPGVRSATIRGSPACSPPMPTRSSSSPSPGTTTSISRSAARSRRTSMALPTA